MLIDSIDGSHLLDDGRTVSIAIIDSGFSSIPQYATMHGSNNASGVQHGNRILSIFTAPDKRFPLTGMRLHLACYNPMTGYDGLVGAVNILPKCDILSISMSWKDNVDELRTAIERKFGTVCAPWSKDKNLLYPGEYEFAVTCSNTENENADYCITPNAEWRGNSYAVPAIARLFAHGYFGRSGSGTMLAVDSLFSACRDGVTVMTASHSGQAGIMTCPNCHRYMRSMSNGGFIVLEHGTPCPYCGSLL
jgi:hypothetical protein